MEASGGSGESGGKREKKRVGGSKTNERKQKANGTIRWEKHSERERERDKHTSKNGHRIRLEER